ARSLNNQETGASIIIWEQTFPSLRLCTKNTSWALIERPYSCAPQAVGAVYDRPGFFVQRPSSARRGMSPRLRIHNLELVNAPAAVLSNVDVVFGIHSDSVRLVELAGEASWPAEAGQDFTGLSIDDFHLFIVLVDQEN